MTLRYGDYGGTVNLVTNGVLAVARSIRVLDGTSNGGVAVAVNQVPNQSLGTLTLSGAIGDFTLGGQEL